MIAFDTDLVIPLMVEDDERQAAEATGAGRSARPCGLQATESDDYSDENAAGPGARRR